MYASIMVALEAPHGTGMASWAAGVIVALYLGVTPQGETASSKDCCTIASSCFVLKCVFL